ncbi:MAG TPA: hypothetical protein DEA26_00790 [Oceanospirillales bacterium]|nr:hypothetical protein [Oceanospirillaceae bacterium]HBS41185.1 hypothetical protein [Oceanospirillales bacterium]|tara:strand:+ start:1089 stop:1865 length:777 start_codon:yes stop_codon:yes gene_type:complete
MVQRVRVFKPTKLVGRLYIREAGQATAPRYHMGNSSELKLTYDEQVIPQPDYDSVSGGVAAEVRLLNSIEFAAALHDLNADNLALLQRGTRTTITGATVTDEAITAHKGALISLANINAKSVVVTSSDGNTTYTEGDDYEVTGAGVLINSTGAIATAIDALPDPTTGLDLLVDYTFADYQRIQPFTESGKTYELLLDGMNQAEDGLPVVITLWKVNVGVLTEWLLKGDSIASLPFAGKLLADKTKGQGESAYLQIDQV